MTKSCAEMVGEQANTLVSTRAAHFIWLLSRHAIIEALAVSAESGSDLWINNRYRAFGNGAMWGAGHLSKLKGYATEDTFYKSESQGPRPHRPIIKVKDAEHVVAGQTLQTLSLTRRSGGVVL
ncbi:hypothetical protein J6590_008965 [Homalodisca vitripennis]|nr:hypothetical protein J6590_008965 [Homalodisca vitripennis]